MQGTIINHKGEAVKSAEISVRKIASVSETGISNVKDGSEGPLEQHLLDEVVCVQTDEEGNFTLRHLDPDAKYVFEIRLKEFISADQTDNLPNSYIQAPIRAVETKDTAFDVRLGATGGKNSVSGNEARKDPHKNGWNDRDEDNWNDQEEDDWNDQEEDDWNDSEDGWDNRDRDHPINTVAADNDDDYDDSEWFDIQEQEVMEQYAGNMIVQKKDLEEKLVTIRKYIW
ncbi:MAG: hypothetical protein K0Q48_2072 [Bacillota bacterium]|jgi:hypothetical protein|nr:hypothetical protein [Bacillota bacterium]